MIGRHLERSGDLRKLWTFIVEISHEFESQKDATTDSVSEDLLIFT